MKAVSYGPFPGGWPGSFAPDFSGISAAGFNAIRIYEMPSKNLLDKAAEYGLKVFGGLQWGQTADFLRSPGLYSAAKVSLTNSLAEVGNHPAFAGVYVGNEIPKDLVRWMGALKVRQAIEGLIDLGKQIAPHLLLPTATSRALSIWSQKTLILPRLMSTWKMRMLSAVISSGCITSREIVR